MVSDLDSFRRLAAVTAILATVLALASSMDRMAATGFNLTQAGQLAAYVALGPAAAVLMRWSTVLAVFGYSLLLLPVLVFLWYGLRSQSPVFASLYLVCSLGAVLVGAAGTSVLATIAPPLMLAYPESTVAQQGVLALVFETSVGGIENGLWAITSAALAGVGWFGFGLLLRHECRNLGVFTLALGLVSLVHALATILGVQPVADTTRWIYLGLAPVWSLWLGIDLLRHSWPVATAADMARGAGDAARPSAARNTA